MNKGDRLNWNNVVRLILLALVVLGVVSFCTLDFGYWESSVEYEPDGLTVTVGRSGGSRTLKLVDRQGALVEVSLLGEWGPDLRTNLYRTEDGKLGIIDFAGAWKVLQAPLRLERTKPSDHWEYVGTFLRDGYASASQAKECMDILLNEPPPPDRSEMYRRRC